MLTQTISPILGHEEQYVPLHTQTGGSGNGSTTSTSSISSSGDENSRLVAAIEAYLLRQRIDSLLIVTDQCNVSLIPLREQRAYATLDTFDDGGAV